MIPMAERSGMHPGRDVEVMYRCCNRLINGAGLQFARDIKPILSTATAYWVVDHTDKYMGIVSYSDKLKENAWIRKREEVFKKYGKECCECFSSENLQVHHRYYRKGRDPWQYPIDAYAVLCKNCHEDIEDIKMDCEEIEGLDGTYLWYEEYNDGLDRYYDEINSYVDDF